MPITIHPPIIESTTSQDITTQFFITINREGGKSKRLTSELKHRELTSENLRRVKEQLIRALHRELEIGL